MIALLAAACAHEDNAARCTAVKPGQYFAVGTFALEKGEKEFDDLVQSLYGKPLCAMNEQPMTPRAVDEAYRFLWLRTFHHPIAIRVWRKGEERNMAFKELDGAGGYDPGKLIANLTRRLTTDEWDKFIKLLQQASYWQLPTESRNGGRDGAQWILEGKKDEQYHVVDRWSPEGGSYREACLYLLKLSGQKQKELY